MAPSVDRSSRDRLPIMGQIGEIALLPFRLLVRLPILSAQVSQFFLREVVTRPTVLAAILFHSGLLVLPALELTEPQPEELNAPEEEEEPIEVQSLTDLVAASPEVETPPPEQPAAPPPEAPPQQQQVITEVPPDLPEEELPPIEETLPEEPFEETDPLEDLTNAPPAFNPGDAQSGLVGTGSSSGLVDAVPASSFKEADQPFFFNPSSSGRFTALSPPIEAVLTMYYFDTVTYGANAGFAEAQKLAGASGYFLQDAPEGNYGNNPLYTVVDANGNIVSYLSLVLPVDEDSSILVLWKTPPV
ncbi:MAG: hypothetical protein AAFU71_10255 [Cyanobacteria bacterium J06632_22]